MLANDIVLDKTDGTDVTFRLVNSTSDGSRRIDIASTLALPATLVIKHSTSGKPPNLIDRHLVQVNKTVATATGVAVVTGNLTFSVPRDVAVTSTIVHDVITHLIDLLTDGALITGLAVTVNIDSLLRGES
jgi:hypothetical protein